MGNGYLEGGFAPVREEITSYDLEVTGAIPEHLDGRYLRNGPNPAGEIDPAAYNWFMGDGMVHGVRIRGGRAEWYRNRWVRPGGKSRHRAGFEVIGANTNVIGHAGRTLALVEGGNANYELTEELDTVGPCDFDGTIRGGYTAHPLRDPGTGELHAVSYHFGRGNTVQYSVLGADGRARRVIDVEVAGSPMMHAFSLTRNHVVLYDLPVTFDVRRAAEVAVPRPLRAAARLVLSAIIGRVRVPSPLVAAASRSMRPSGLFPYRWNPSYPARVGVMARDGGPVRWFDVEPCYVFHPLNAYDDGDEIVLDVVRHPKMFDTCLLGPDEGPPALDRWTVDLRAGKVREERLCDRPQEFPRLDERLVGHRHRYGYAVAGDCLLKHDLTRGSTETRTFGEGKQLGEFVFEPNGPDAGEDDGVLMGFVYDAATDRSDLVLLDAATLEPIASIHVPQRVPAGFHGNWVPAAS
ncbi:MAG TPA: carotenoid oxygenase family protein [Actinophytocola sp.]|uniref:carotenoid oxygenase family protein n=1 Tax=Actinophytocola sp. TaxID=1872138 RepID=UPI002DDD306D|nr:carotenoid oxygenase family protein [Actinophytocola sp.]HEV2777993.1 carotenoid oxygenase family protein [Actinophytocola sp.]